MQGFSAILTLRKNGIIERELISVKLAKNAELLENIFVTEENNGEFMVRMNVKTGDVEDWEYDAVYDYYDAEIFGGLSLEITEIEGHPYPVWQVSFPYIDSAEKLSAKIEGILNLHRRETEAVLSAIQDVKGEYNDPSDNSIETL